ncbi:histone-lysine N-methyltransferase family member SUVH9-like protein [Tanacetum coccineum]|uniref:Histone-lysine N-methyltransferase family member SUVH9-like protein n=1 Tax=Tanacetum coccineum TaxID=301880 RepID=A0ABQ5A0R0_9ASTR
MKLGSAIYSYHKDETHSISKKSPTCPSPPSSSMDSSLIDLNLYPDLIDNPKPIITPKIEPKSDPIDDVSHTPNLNPNPTPIATVVSHDDVADNNNAVIPILDNQVADNNNGNGNMMTSSCRKSLQRKTRMIYDSLRVLVVMEDDKRREAAINVGGGALGSYARGDLKAASMMKDKGLWLNRDKRIVGAIPGTGHSGQDKHSRQVVHQKLEGGNLAMERSLHYGIEVRVIRVFKYVGSASGKVYVYDGLYKIVEAWFDVGKSGFGVFKFKLVRIVNQVEMGSAVLKFANTLRARPLEAHPVGYPMYYEYLAMTVFLQFVYHLGVKGGRCSCVSGCTLDCLCAKKNGDEFAYDANGLLVRGKPLIFEFVLTRDQAKLFTMNGDALVYPNRFGRDGQNRGTCIKYSLIIACPNVLVQLVLYEHSHYAFPHLMLFAMENIPPLRELSLDYGAAPPNEASPKLAISN